jgi:hypothetical protein
MKITNRKLGARSYLSLASVEIAHKRYSRNSHPISFVSSQARRCADHCNLIAEKLLANTNGSRLASARRVRVLPVVWPFSFFNF